MGVLVIPGICTNCPQIRTHKNHNTIVPAPLGIEPDMNFKELHQTALLRYAILELGLDPTSSVS